MDLTTSARALRGRMTDAELHLWRHLRRNALGVQFRRQVPIGSFVVDFACLRRKLVIEVDGGQHLENPQDKVRDEWLQAQGYRVLRFWDHEVLKNVEAVLEVIFSKLGVTDLRRGGIG
jgi:very-short-patch-repair endonuclease